VSFAVYLDEHVDPLLATLLQQLGHDVLTTVQAGNRSQADEEQMIFAAATGRAIFTYDIADYRRIATDWTATSRKHFGVITARQRPPHELRDRFLILFDQYPDGIADFVIGLPRLP
jgi:predicted nuclease of predicted toxin-antitoxin system